MSDVAAVRAALAEAAASLEKLYRDDAALATIARAGELLADTFAAGGRAYSCGNGGSMCDAMHFAEELTGRFRDNRPGFAALAISDASASSRHTAVRAMRCWRFRPAERARTSSPRQRSRSNCRCASSL
jgi:phosphoheptose isomerase